MRTAARPRLGLILLLLLVLLAAGFLLYRVLKPVLDPHAGQVYLYDGFDWIWYTPLEGVKTNPWKEEDFRFAGGIPSYLHEDYAVKRGIDVSEHQKEIDWSQVRSAGLDYACIRLGRRGYTEGQLFEDPYYKRNMQDAAANGLEIGVYFFSQAVNVQEAIEEARFVLERLSGYSVQLPVYFDWEKIDTEDSRTKSLSLDIRTDCAVAFCQTVRNAGYESGIYFNRNIGYYGYDLSRLTDYSFWFALPQATYPSFYYAVDSWQYSFSETVPGIATETDMNLFFVPVPPETEAAA